MELWRFGEILSNGFKNELQEGFIELTPDAGSPFRRVVFTDTQDLIQGTFNVSRFQYIDFMGWYRNTIKQGTIEFEYYDCRVDANRVARVIGKPTYTTISDRFNISITLSLEPYTTIQDEAIFDSDNVAIADSDGVDIDGRTEVII